MLAAGVQPKVVQEMLGLSHVSITLGIYGQVTPTMGREAGAALSASLLGARGEDFFFLLVFPRGACARSLAAIFLSFFFDFLSANTRRASDAGFFPVAIVRHLSPSGDKRMTRALVIASRRRLPTL